ncbi:MAG: hypothetical protein RMJ98_14405 [Myxococcales bacterium]|nr:hypothetical protein [Myxococcales bacterium]
MLAFLLAVLRWNREPQQVVSLLVVSYLIRIILQFFLRDIPLFSHGAGGDCLFYERMAIDFSRIWSYRGVEFYTNEEVPAVGNAALPINLFAFIIYLNGGETRAGCTAVVAACSVLACYHLYRMAIELGADPARAFQVMRVLLFLPGFLYYSADMYKDGLVLFFVVLALTSSFRLAARFSLPQALLSCGSLWALWYVRHYLVFLTVAPLAVGLIGFGKGSLGRQIVLGVGMSLVLVAIARSSLGERVLDQMQNTFEFASDVNTRQWNQLGGSGVSFDDGGQAFGAIHLKILYTLFSPFPWQAGSIGFQIGKIDTLIWYFFFARLLVSAKRLWTSDRSLLFMFLIFLVPLTVAYATTMANIGLILRQRIPIVFVGAMLGMLSWQAIPGHPAFRLRGRAA